MVLDTYHAVASNFCFTALSHSPPLHRSCAVVSGDANINVCITEEGAHVHLQIHVTGMLFVWLVCPSINLKVIKSRLQQRSTTKEVQTGSARYRGTLHCATEIGRKEGLRGFFKGCLAHAVRAAPASAITFVVYEEVLKALV